MPKELVSLMTSNYFKLLRKNKHLVWKRERDGALVFTSQTPSDWRALRKVERDIRRLDNAAGQSAKAR